MQLRFQLAAHLLPPAPRPPTPPCAAEITLNLGNMRPEVRAEWEELRQHDVLFLLTIRPPDSITANYMAQAQAGRGGGGSGRSGEAMSGDVMERYGLQYVRGCEVVELRDEGEAVLKCGEWGAAKSRLL